MSNALTGLSLLHVGESFAMLGEYRRCEQALSQAETSFGRIGSSDPGAEFFSATQLGRSADRPKTRSLVLGNVALAYLRQRQLDAATVTLHEAIDVLETSRGGGAMTVVFSVAREVYPWRAEPAVHDVHDRLLALVARA